MKYILPVLLLICAPIYVQLTTQPAASKIAVTKSNWQILSQKNYSIRYPANWQVEQKEDLGAGVDLIYPFTILAPLESPADKFRENVNLVIETLKGRTIEGEDGSKIDLKRYAELSIAQLEAQMKNCQILETKRIDRGRRSFYRVIFTWDYETFNLKVEQYYQIVNGKAYVLTFTSESDKFDKFRGTGEKILNTFSVRK
jgi:hypothetical protein